MKDFSISCKLFLSTLLIFGLFYPLLIWGIGQIIPENAQGFPIKKNGQVIGFQNIGQKFTQEKYFWGRPSAVDYNAAATGGSNLGPTNPKHLAEVKQRQEDFLTAHRYLKKSEIPAEMLTASGGGLDPHISPYSALMQAKRVAKVRQLPENQVIDLIKSKIEYPYLGFLGTERVNVLVINLALDNLKKAVK
jgi:K+-transporting ATPase ATPase C chain